MDAYTTISVIVPAFGAQAKIGSSLEAAKTATGPGDDVIVLDDHATDDTNAIATAVDVAIPIVWLDCRDRHALVLPYLRVCNIRARIAGNEIAPAQALDVSADEHYLNLQTYALRLSIFNQSISILTYEVAIALRHMPGQQLKRVGFSLPLQEKWPCLF